MWRHVASNALSFFVVLLFLAGGAVLWGVNEYSAEGPLEQPICLQVPAGTNMRRVSADLAEQGAVSSGTVFLIGGEYADKTRRLRQGSYLIPAEASMAEIADIVTRGGASTCGTQVVYTIGVADLLARVRELDPATSRFREVVRFSPLSDEPPPEYLAVRERADTQYAVLVVEGTTVWQVARSLNALDILQGEVIELPPEGSLAPDSYDVVPGAQVEALLARMSSAQARILAEEWAGRADGLPLETPEEALILASIIEKETSVPDERRQVSSVFVNRLNRRMRLQTDPTVIYGVTNGEGVLGRGLRRSELDTPTPWNTYVIDGLPPTPIANPGRAAINAALNPDTTEYVFFVADGTGGHAFATNLDDHNRNVARWRQIEAEQAAAQAAAQAETAEN
ncbi:MAG: endolytic transglycosylase MltG [Rhodobacteraceae bacterium]|nr:endolytic transglycosylase MltG [Paracoccaceae bacterium]